MVRIIYDEMPDVDSLLVLLYNITLARELKDYWLEEELMAKLIYIMRCPQILFYVTRIRKIVPVNQQILTRQSSLNIRVLPAGVPNPDNWTTLQ